MNALFLTDSTLVFAVLVHCQGFVTGQFTAAPHTCSGDIFSFTCTVVGDVSGITTWRVNGSSECHLSHRSTSSSSICGPENDFTARSGTGFGTNDATSFTSSLSGTGSSTMDGILFECFGPDNNVNPENRVGSSTLQIIDPPSLNLSCVDLSEDTDGAVNVTVTWTLSGGDSADYYLINIITNAPQIPYGGLLNITNASVTQHELTGFMAGYEYNITICGVNCRRQEGRDSEPLTVTHQEYAAPIFGMCAVYDIQNSTLQLIESTWNEVDPIIISEDCVNGRDMRASYELLYTTESGALHTTCVVDGTECSSGTCHHQLKNSTVDSRCQPPVSQFGSEVMTMSLVASNIVGRSISIKSRIITGRNIDLEVRIDTTNLSSSFVECTFIQPGYNCTIDYGTDPSYTNLVYRDTSSTQGRRATITLSQEIRGGTTYHYTVSAESNSRCMKVQGKFRADQAGGIVGDDVEISTVLLIVITIFTGIFILIVTFIIFGIGVRAIVNAQRRAAQAFDERRNQDDAQERNQDDAQVTNEDGAQERNQDDAQGINQDGAQERDRNGARNPDDAQERDRDGARNQDDAQERDQDYEGSPLHIAAQDGDLKMMESLVDENTDINIKAENGRTPLHVAAERGCSRIVKYLVDKGAVVDIEDNNGMTPLHVAAANGHFEKIVGYLVKKGATINFKDNDGRTPLHIAVRECQEKTVKSLVEKGADTNIQDDIGWTPLHVAVKHGYEKTVKYLVVEKTANPNIKDKDDRTPLHVAAATGGRYENIVEDLVDNNADINIQDKNWQTPLHVAAREGHEYTVKALLGKTPNVNITDKEGRTPLDIAVKRSHDVIANDIRASSTGILRRRITTMDREGSG